MQYFLLFAVLIGGVVIMCQGAKKNSEWPKYIGAALVVICILAFPYNWFHTGLRMEWNPIVEHNQLVGEWRYNKMLLRLDANGKYLLTDTSSGRRYSGLWSLDDWNLYLGQDQMRVVLWDCKPRIIRPSGPDTWDHSLGYEKVRP